MVIGNIYYFEVGVIDSTNCEYSIKVLAGSTAVPQLTAFTLDNIYDPCQGETVDYTVLNPEPITDYIYTLNGDTISREASAQVTYNEPGTYELCITGSNPCSQATLTCYTITVNPPTGTTAEAYLCPGECYITPDTTLCTAGTYALRLTDRNGCDSLVDLTLLDRTPDVTDLQTTICSGDSLRYLGQTYFTDGVYPSLLTNRFGCDSTVNLEIVTATCPLNGSIEGGNVVCYDGTDGSVRFTLTSGSPPFRYDFRRLGGGPTGNGTVALRNETTTLTGLPAGTYLIEVTDDFGSVGYFNTTIDRPLPVEVTLISKLYNGSDLRCSDSADGQLTASAIGGTGSFTYVWSTAKGVGDRATGLAAGTYSVTATDINGCQSETSASLLAPVPLSVQLSASNEICNEPGSGSITVSSTQGGAGIINTQVFDADTGREISPADFVRLPATAYRVVSTDANGCVADTTVFIASPLAAVATISPSDPVIALGESITLSSPSQNDNRYVWTSGGAVICQDCSSIDLLPTTNTNYILSVISPDGCTASDTTTVTVERKRQVYIPSAFSPNGDGNNDVLTVYPGKAAVTILEFAVYDRWGGLLYQVKDIPASDNDIPGWDGMVAGSVVQTGVYAWLARVRYLDGVIKTERGSAVLIR